MKKILSLLLLAGSGQIFGQVNITGNRIDLTHAQATRPIKVVTVLPTGVPPQLGCLPGDMVQLAIAPLGSQIYINSATGIFSANWQQYLAASVPVTGTSYTMFIADRAYRVKGARTVASSSAAVPTIDITKDTGTGAPGSGSSVLSSATSINTTANTVNVATASATVANATLAAGDRLAIKWGGTVGSLTGATVSVLLVPV